MFIAQVILNVNIHMITAGMVKGMTKFNTLKYGIMTYIYTLNITA